MSEFEKDVVHIDIINAYSIIKGDAPWSEVYDVCSYVDPGSQFSKAYRRGLWNGRKYLINKKTGAFPSGLIKFVKEVCEEEGKTVFIHDKRTDPGSMGVYGKGSFDLNNLKMDGKYQFQRDSCDTAVELKQGILKLATGAGKATLIAAITNYLQLPTLITVPSKELLYQLRKTLLEEIPGATEDSIGIIGDSEWQVGTWVTVAIVDTLASRLNSTECQNLLNNVDLLINDECHGTGSDSYYDVLSTCNAYYRYGFSGTPVDRTDGANLKVYALFGDIIVDVKYKELVESQVLPKAAIIIDKVTKPILPSNLKYPAAYKAGVVENEYMTEKAVEWTKICVECGLSVLILVEQISHGKAVDDALWALPELIPHTFISGQAGEEANRKEGFEAFDRREIPVLISSNILSTGVSSKSIDVLIRLGVKKSTIQTLQGLGRALRGDSAIVIEFANYTNKYLLEHSLKRLRDYKAEDCFTIVSSEPNKELIQRLWNDQQVRRQKA